MDGRFTLFSKHTANADTDKQLYKNEIRHNLNTLHISDAAVNKILNTVDTMPAAMHVLGALRFLTALTDKTSVCENYYQHSDYIAEFFCTISNLGFFAVAYYYHDYATLLAGTFSALSHAVPLKRLNELDKLAAVALFLKLISHYDILLENPAILASGAAAFVIGALDIYAGRKNLDIFGPAFHVAWHLVAALALYQFNEAGSHLQLPHLCR